MASIFHTALLSVSADSKNQLKCCTLICVFLYLFFKSLHVTVLILRNVYSTFYVMNAVQLMRRADAKRTINGS